MLVVYHRGDGGGTCEQMGLSTFLDLPDVASPSDIYALVSLEVEEITKMDPCCCDRRCHFRGITIQRLERLRKFSAWVRRCLRANCCDMTKKATLWNQLPPRVS